MARSRNEHTTRMLAYALKMNYAWGLEFLELTNGNSEEQESTKGMSNLLGLHGNAILAKCNLMEPIVMRDRLADMYFSEKATFGNAYGTEKRLGGRMAFIASVEDPASKQIIRVGSIHKLGEENDSN